MSYEIRTNKCGDWYEVVHHGCYSSETVIEGHSVSLVDLRRLIEYATNHNGYVSIDCEYDFEAE